MGRRRSDRPVRGHRPVVSLIRSTQALLAAFAGLVSLPLVFADRWDDAEAVWEPFLDDAAG